jgi:hypothetical protein
MNSTAPIRNKHNLVFETNDLLCIPQSEATEPQYLGTSGDLAPAQSLSRWLAIPK